MTKLIVGCVLVAVTSLAVVEGGAVECSIRGKGQLKSFSNNKVGIKLPCKYKAALLECQGYRVRVAPGQALDKKIRYYVDTAWVTVKKMGTKFSWTGRISATRLERYFNDTSRDIFDTKEPLPEGATFNMEFKANRDEWYGQVGVNDAGFKVTFYGYDVKDKLKRKKAGVVITCPNGEFSEKSTYPATFCGNDTDPKVITTRRKELGLGSRSKSVLYDVMNSDQVTQNNAKCDIAARVFQACEPGSKTEVMKECGALVANVSLMRCLTNRGFDPMDTFAFCLKFRCEDDPESCVLLQEHLKDCKNRLKAAKETCPKMEL